jgi:hypothetical protein
MRWGLLLGFAWSGWRLPYGEEMRFLCSGASKLGRSLTEFVSPVLLAVRQQDGRKGSVFAPGLAVWQLARGSGHLCPCVAAKQ